MSLKKLADDAIKKANQSSTKEQLDNSKTEEEKQIIFMEKKRQIQSVEFYNRIADICKRYREQTGASHEAIAGHLICYANAIVGQILSSDKKEDEKNKKSV